MNLPTDFKKIKHGFSKSIVILYKSLQISKRLFVTTKLKSYGGSRREEFLLSRAFYIDSKQIERMRPIVCSSIRRIVNYSFCKL